MSRAITLTPELAYRAISPSTAFWEAHKYPKEEDAYTYLPWNESHLNPKNRIDSLTPVQTPTWTVHGSTGLGTQFFTVPVFISPLPPLRIDTFLPDPAYWPAKLRLDLNLNEAFLFRDSRIVKFGICQHILRALEFWSASISNFEIMYRELPFGSRIMFENMSKDIRNIRIRVIRTHDLERQLLPLAALKLNRLNPLPEILDISQLTLIRQFQDSAALVRVIGSDENDVVVFKTLSDTPKYLYHELEILLTMPEYANIISRPRHIVTKNCRFGGKVAVLGFTIRYHKQGSLRDILPFKGLHGILAMNDQIKWASQVVKALQHIKSKGPGWYCDLRLDNILLSDADDVILIDFEQRGVLPAFASPMDNNLQYINALINEPSLNTAMRKEYMDLYDLHVRPFVPKRRDQHQGCVPWLCMSKSEREASEMYMVGRLLWCIFEGVSAPQKELWMEYLHEPDIEFPEFRRTPQQLRELIWSCTPGWIGVNKVLQRKAFELKFLVSSDSKELGKEGFLGDLVATWDRELDRARSIVKNRGDHTSSANSNNPVDGRLTLEDVLQKIEDCVAIFENSE
ncbi:hypothetical protein IFR05_000191 [Cadophora sp. M221]|nr:hypothetical protein IFR05_000191 [Cadophora sp. M221]